jgi:hypothetical protein
MRESWLVILFGDSLLMDAVEASLADSPEFGIVRVHTAVADVAARLETLCPDLVVFDINAPAAQFAIPFLKGRPNVPLIGLDLTCSKVITLCCEHHTVLTSDDLDNVIRCLIANTQRRRTSNALPSARHGRNLSIMNHAIALMKANGLDNGAVENSH